MKFTRMATLAGAPRSEESKHAYDSSLALILQTVLKRGIEDRRIFSSVEGAFPAHVMKLLWRDNPVLAAELINDVSVNPQSHPAVNDLTLYDWRYSEETVSDMIAVLPTVGAKVACLGTPTIAAALWRSSAGQCTLYDLARPLTSPAFGNGAWQKVDLGAVRLPSSHDADVIFIDPPWHIAHYWNWMSSALALAHEESLIAIALPQRLTKSSASMELGLLRRFFSTLGEVEFIRDALVYETPSFERGVLSGYGLGGLDDWRRGDLALVRLKGRRESPFFPLLQDQWVRVRTDSGLWASKNGVMTAHMESALHDLWPRLRMLEGVGRRYLQTQRINLVHSLGMGASVGEGVAASPTTSAIDGMMEYVDERL